ncbi:60S ribosomal protein L27B [Coniosporium tulheliwenetii]|uniref:60S ribosomal protein L27B n=1 Tax=Coniosporium tulheliwenetii TaxID=3383036 RepID=A0ACC2ZNJ4_9PEZI|nr:60S ribosomal protein L27B [Cladosporium sp. JES 115]
MPAQLTTDPVELEGLKGAVSADNFKEVSQREDAKKNVKKVLEERYQSGKNQEHCPHKIHIGVEKVANAFTTTQNMHKLHIGSAAHQINDLCVWV